MRDARRRARAPRARIVAALALALVAARARAGRAREATGRANDGDDVAALRDALPNDGATLSELFRWSIEAGHPRASSDADDRARGDAGRAEGWRARARAALARATGRRDDGASAVDAIDDDEGAEAEAGRSKTVDSIESRKREVREALDAMAAAPSPHALARECGEVVRDARKNETKARRVRALEILYDLVAPIELANDLDKLGVAEALIGALRDEDEDVASAAASALAAAASNNVVVQGIIHERRGFDALLELVSSPATPAEVRHKSLWVLGMCARTHEASRADFFAAGGAGVLADILSPKTPVKTRTRAMVLFGDLVLIDGVADAMFADVKVAKSLLEDVVASALDADASLDAREKALGALLAARERGPEIVRHTLDGFKRDLSTLADAFDAAAKAEDDDSAADISRLARALSVSPRVEL